MAKTFFLAAALLGALASHGAYAQQAPEKLTLKEAVQMALNNHVALAQQKNILLSTQAQRTSAMAMMGPQVSIGGNLYQSSGNSFNQQQGEVVNGVMDVVGGRLNVNVPLFNGGSGLYGMRQSFKENEAQVDQVRRTAQQVINDVAMQYLQVLLDGQLLGIARENVALQEKQYTLVKEQVGLGSRAPVDEFSQLALFKNAELRALEAEFNLLRSKALLSSLLQRDPSLDMALEEPAWEAHGVADSLDVHIVQALGSRADLKRLREMESASRFGLMAGRGQLLPSLSAFYTNGSAYNNIHGTPAGSYRSFGQQFFTDNRYQAYGLSFNIPVFSGLRARTSFVRAKVAYENSRLETKKMELTVRGEVVLAYRQLSIVQKAFDSGKAQYEAARMAFDLEKERFELGLTNFVDFANANRAFVQAQADFVQARYRYVFQRILFDYAVGTLSFEGLP